MNDNGHMMRDVIFTSTFKAWLIGGMGTLLVAVGGQAIAQTDEELAAKEAVPQAVDEDPGRPDLSTAQTTSGEIAAAWVFDGKLYGAVVGRDLRVQSLGVIGEGEINPSVAFDDLGRPWVAAYRPASREVVIKELRAGVTGWRTVNWEKDFALDDPYPLLSFNEGAPYVFVSGRHGGLRGFYCYRGTATDGAFELVGQGPPVSLTSKDIYISVRRPQVVRTASGVNRLVYAVKGGYVYLNSWDGTGIQPLNVPAEPTPGYVNQGDVTSGTAFDERSGAMAFVNRDANLIVVDEMGQKIDEAGLKVPFQEGFDSPNGPNRRTYAVADDGRNSVYLGGLSIKDKSIFAAARKVDGEWGLWTEPSEMGLICPRAHYHEPSRSFVILAIDGDQLDLYQAGLDGSPLNPTKRL